MSHHTAASQCCYNSVVQLPVDVASNGYCITRAVQVGAITTAQQPILLVVPAARGAKRNHPKQLLPVVWCAIALLGSQN
jgi:hypothetical protein